jgi:hypothetical protein
VHLPLQAFLGFFWRIAYPPGGNTRYYIGPNAYNPDIQEHAEFVYGSVFDLTLAPFSLLQHYYGDPHHKKHRLRYVAVNHYGLRVLHNYYGRVRRIRRITRQYLTE